MDKIKMILQGLATSLEKLNKISLPATILIASIVLGGFYYVSEANKSASIKKQQEIKNTTEALQLNQDECKSLSAGVMKEWNNVVGVTYNDFWKECEVTYTDTKTGKLKYGRLSDMQTIK